MSVCLKRPAHRLRACVSFLSLSGSLFTVPALAQLAPDSAELPRTDGAPDQESSPNDGASQSKQPTAPAGETSRATGEPAATPRAGSDQGAAGASDPLLDRTSAGARPGETPALDSTAAPGTEPSAEATGALGTESSSEAALGAASPYPAVAGPVVDQKQPPADEPSVDYSALPWTYHQRHIDVAAGIVFNRTADEALLPYLDAPAMVEGFIRAGGAFMSTGAFSLAALAEFGGGRAESNARNLDTQLSFMHVTAGLEPRFHLLPRLYVYGRVMAGAEHSRLGLGYTRSSERLQDGAWAFRLDGNLGLGLRVAGARDGRKRSPRLWLFAEGGYRYTSDFQVQPEVDSDSGPARAVALGVEPYSPHGARLALGVMATF